MKTKSPLRLFQIGLALLIIFGSFDTLRFLDRYAVESFHYPIVPSWWIPSISFLEALTRVRVFFAALILLNCIVSPAFAFLGLSGIYILLATPTHFHHNVYLLHLLCLWTAFCGRPSSDSIPIPTRWQQRLFLIQASAVYGFSALHKLTTPDWLTGRTLFAFAQEDVFHFLTPILTRNITGLISPVLIATELFLAVALWFPRTRRWAVMIGVLFHTSFDAMTPIGLFSWEMLLVYVIAIVPDEPDLLRPLWFCSLSGILLFGIRSLVPAAEIIRYFAFPLGIATVIALNSDARIEK